MSSDSGFPKGASRADYAAKVAELRAADKRVRYILPRVRVTRRDAGPGKGAAGFC